MENKESFGFFEYSDGILLLLIKSVHCLKSDN